jgi:RNA polymerase sigma-70 factor (ECF subfamily)
MNLIDLSSLFSASDEQMMTRVRDHDDAEAFGRLVAKWQCPIQRLCVRMLGDSHRGEDLAQEAFVKLYAKRKQYEPSARFSTYLWRVALNLCYDELRRLKRRPELPLETESPDGDESFSFLDAQPAEDLAPDNAMENREQAEIVRIALQKLPEHYRSVVVLRHYENLKFREIAEVLDIPEGTVKSRMSEGLEQLHQILTRAFRAEPIQKPPGNSPKRKEILVL